MFAFAVLRLAITPADFWALSVSEWRALVTVLAPDADVMDAAALGELMQTIEEQNHA